MNSQKNRQGRDGTNDDEPWPKETEHLETVPEQDDPLGYTPDDDEPGLDRGNLGRNSSG
jgi:hypothetical protein